MRKLVNLSLWLSLISPFAFATDANKVQGSAAKCNCSQECKENCNSGKDKNCKCDEKSCECKNGKSCH